MLKSSPSNNLIFVYLRKGRRFKKVRDAQGKARFVVASRGEKIGILVAQKIGQDINFGWSLCALKPRDGKPDVFDRQLGLNKAIERLGSSLTMSKVPPVVRRGLLKFIPYAIKRLNGSPA